MTEDSTDYIPPASGESLYTHPVELTKIPTVLPELGRIDIYQDLKRHWYRVQEKYPRL